MIEETIARLTGRLIWTADTSGLIRFERQMQRASQMMAQLGAQAKRLQSQLNLKAKVAVESNTGFAAMSRKADELKRKLQMSIGVKDTDTTTAKAAAELERNQAKQLRREALLGRARKATFAAELQQSKLVAAGKKEDLSLATASVRLEQQKAVLAAKQSAAQQASLKSQGLDQKNQQTLLAAKARQMRLEQLVQQTAIKTQTLQARHAQTLTGVQRAELALQQARERGQRQQEKFQQSQVAAKLRESRQEQGAQQRASRFGFTQERHAAWQASQARRETERSDGGGVSLMGLTGAVAGITAAAYIATKAFDALADRVKDRQKGAEEAQSFNNVFKSISPDEKVQTDARERFIKSQKENAGVIDEETAKDFRVMASNMLAAGKTMDQVMSVWENRQKTFAIAGTSKDDNRELNKQLGQLASDGTGNKQDADIINNRMPMIVPFVVREYMKDNKITDFQQGLKAFNSDLKGGAGIKGEWYENAMTNLVASHQADLERNRNSVANAQTQADNQVFLANNAVNTSEELTTAMNENIKAHRDLNDAMAPLRNTMLALDIGLTQFSTFLLRMSANRNPDGTEKTEQQKMQDTMSTADLPVSTSMVNTGDYSGIDGNTQHQGGPIGKFWNWMFNVKEQPKEEFENNPWGDVKASPLFPSAQGSLDTNGLDKYSRPNWGKMLTDLPVFNPANMVNIQDTLDRSLNFQPAIQRQVLSPTASPSTQPSVINNTTNTNISPPVVNTTINITAAPGDKQEIAETVKNEVRGEIQKVFTSYQPKEAH